MRKHKKYFVRPELLRYTAEGAAITVLIAWVFYHSIFASVILSPTIFIFAYKRNRDAAERRKRQFNIQFKDAIIAISSALKSGYSLENSVAESGKEMELLYGKDSDIYRELCHINSNISLNIPVERLFLQLAESKSIEDINIFAEIIVTAKRTGGNMIEIIENTANVISQKIETRREIDVLISAKKIQQKIMNIVPVFMIAYVSVTSSDFFDIMYRTVTGRLIMTVCLAVYIVSYCLSERIVNVEI